MVQGGSSKKLQYSFFFKESCVGSCCIFLHHYYYVASSSILIAKRKEGERVENIVKRVDRTELVKEELKRGRGGFIVGVCTLYGYIGLSMEPVQQGFG